MGKILFLPGDGIGPEVAGAARRVLEVAAARFGLDLRIEEALVGGAAYEAKGSPLPAETVQACKTADAVFLGAVGGPRWDGVERDKRPEAGLLALRQELGVFANLRPISVYPELAAFSCLRPDLVAEGVDLLVVRELTGDIYFGEHSEGKSGAKRFGKDVMYYDEDEIRRIAQVGFQTARGRRGRVCSVDKANVLAASRLWRAVVSEVGREYPDVELEHMYVDNAAMQLVARPAHFDVLLTANLFGDILSDLAAALAGSLGLLPSASMGERAPGLFEPAHGSAPGIAGQDKANPLAAILSAALLLRLSRKAADGKKGTETARAAQAAEAIQNAVKKAIGEGWRTADLLPGKQGSPGRQKAVGCRAMTDKVIERL